MKHAQEPAPTLAGDRLLTPVCRFADDAGGWLAKWWAVGDGRRGRRGGIALVLASLVCAAQPAEPRERAVLSPRTESRSLRLELRGARLSLEVYGRPWAEVLAELERKTGIVLHLRPRPEGAVTASFKDLPVERALRRLFGLDADYVFRYEASGARPAAFVPLPSEVWIVGGASGKPAAVVATGDSSPVPARPSTPVALPAAVTHADSLGEIRALTDEDATAPRGGAGFPHPPDGPRAETPGDPFEGPRAMATEDPVTAGNPVHVALRDPDPSIRIHGVQILANPGDDSGVETLEQLIGADPDVEVRAAAAEALLRIGSPRALAAVQQGLYDHDIASRVPDAEALREALWQGSGDANGDSATVRELETGGTAWVKHPKAATRQRR